jgi:hypothetical protein
MIFVVTYEMVALKRHPLDTGSGDAVRGAAPGVKDIQTGVGAPGLPGRTGLVIAMERGV